MTGYCLREKRQVQIHNPRATRMRGGERVTAGECPHCGTKVFASATNLNVLAKLASFLPQYHKVKLAGLAPRLGRRDRAVSDGVAQAMYDAWISGQLEDYPGPPPTTPTPQRPRDPEGNRYDARF